MKLESLHTRHFMFVLVGCLLGTAAAVWAQTSTILPFASAPITLSFGMMGLSGGQTVRLNVVNIVRTPPPIAIAQIPCRVELTLFDAQGNVIKQNAIDALGYGKSAFIEAERTSIADPVSRAQVTATVKVGSAQSFFCSVTPTLEVYDTATGRTQAIQSNAVPAPSFIRPLVTEPVEPGEPVTAQ